MNEQQQDVFRAKERTYSSKLADAALNLVELEARARLAGLDTRRAQESIRECFPTAKFQPDPGSMYRFQYRTRNGDFVLVRVVLDELIKGNN